MKVNSYQTQILPKNECCTPPLRLQFKRQPVCDQVQFGCKGSYTFVLKNVSDIPCAYCGKTMITTAEQKLFGQEIQNLTGINLQNKIAFIKNEDKFPFEQKIAGLLTKISQKSPDKNLQELLIEILPDAEKKLLKKQKKILNKLPAIIEKITGETKKQAFDKLDEINRSLVGTFKKQKAIKDFQEINEQETSIANKTLLKESLEALFTLPAARNDVHALIVKYSRRSPREIGEILLDPFLASAEHIRPVSDGGLCKQSNYLGVHKFCNEARGSEPFPAFLNNNPEVIPNIEKQLKIILIKIEAYEAPFELDNYPVQVAATLKRLSYGKININEDALKAPDKTLEKLFKKLLGKKGNS